VIDWLLEPFGNDLGRRAMAELLVLALACGPLGVWVLLYRESYAAESISHGMLPGLVLAALAGAPLVVGAVGGMVVAAAAVAAAGRDERLGTDVGVAVAVTALTGLGAMLALAPDAPPRLRELLFGDLLGVRGGDLAVAALLAIGVGVALAAAFRPLSLAAFDRPAARSLGARPGRWELALLLLLALTIVAAVQAVGNLLVIALLIAPGATALQLTARLPAALAVAVLVAAGAGVVGLEASHHLELAAGASVALAALVAFALALAVPRRAA
jgi:ABC-type Mn2+/Zn2+ transport system permease subunit